MDAELPAGGRRKFPVWIIEHVWAHRMMDIQEAVDPSSWPDVDSQPLSLEDSWRLRVASARVYSIVKSRDVEHYETATGFLEATYRLLPRLVTAIKHMKIMFGLKTMVIMWMLKQRQGTMETVSKIVQFFPNKLPQYQDQCSQREMFLMRKNHAEFKGFAQALAMDKDRLEDYLKNQMEDQYGERYAQKVEDRLLVYLQQLETVLPGDTYIDTLLKKQSPVTEEEKLLLEVINSDHMTIATTLKKLLHCDVASCHPAPQAPDSPEGHLESGQTKTPQPEVFRGDKDAGPDHSPLLLESASDAGGQPGEDAEVVEKAEGGSSDNKHSSGSSEGVREAASSSPQFCFKHRRWVKSILKECPDECSEELQLQANISSSPPLFPSSSSTSSSQDLTPSDLAPCPPGQPPSQTPAQTSETANLKEKPSSGSTASDTEPRPVLVRNPLLPNLLSPVVRLVDIYSFRGNYAIFKPHPTSPDRFIICKPEPSASSPQIPTPVAAPAPQHVPDSIAYTPTRHTFSRWSQQFRQSTTRSSPVLTRKQVSSACSSSIPFVTPAPQDLPISTDCPPTRRTFSKLSRKFGQATTRHSQRLKRNQVASASSPEKLPAPHVSQDESTSSDYPPTGHTSSRLSPKFGQATAKHSPTLTRNRLPSASSPPIPPPVAAPAPQDVRASTSYLPSRHSFSSLSGRFGQATTRSSPVWTRNRAASASSPQIPVAAAAPQDDSTSTDYQSTRHTFTKLSRKVGQATTRHSPVLTRKRACSASSFQIPLVAPESEDESGSTNYQLTQLTSSRLQTTPALTGKALAEQFASAFQKACPPLSSSSTHDSSASTSQSWSLSSVCTATPSSASSSQQGVPQNFITSPTSQSETPSTSDRRAQLRLSLPSQAVLLQSKLLQPYVSLTRLSADECNRATDGRASTGCEESTEQGCNEDDRNQEDDTDCSFDVNSLFSGSDGEDSPDSDPDYRPHIKKKTLLLEYENARMLNNP